MTDLQIWQPSQAEIAQYEAPSGPLDDWIMVADKVVSLANVIANSPFVPDGLRGSVPAVAAAILTGRELQIPPMTSLANIHVIHGRPGLSALVMRALIQSKGHDWRDVEVTNTRVVLEGRRRGTSDWTRASFSADDAARAKIQLGGYPQDKLYARATSRLARRAFADVIAGMPYSIEELEDGVTEDEPAGNVGVTGPGSNGTPPAVDKPRTAQRKQRTQNSPPAPVAPPGAGAAPPSAERAGGDLPPLPGEEDAPGPETTGSPGAGTEPASGPGAPDETDYDTHGTATRGKGGQLTALWTVLSTEFGFSDGEKPHARAVCEHIVNRKLTGGTTGDLSYNEAKTVLDTLAHWQHQAEKEGKRPRDYMTSLMAAQDEDPRDE